MRRAVGDAPELARSLPAVSASSSVAYSGAVSLVIGSKACPNLSEKLFRRLVDLFDCKFEYGEGQENVSTK
jgi:hypothetical protein